MGRQKRLVDHDPIAIAESRDQWIRALRGRQRGFREMIQRPGFHKADMRGKATKRRSQIRAGTLPDGKQPHRGCADKLVRLDHSCQDISPIPIRLIRAAHNDDDPDRDK